MKKIGLIALVTLLAFSTSKSQTNAKEDNKIYSIVAVKNRPQFPGGMAAFYKFLSANIKYPEQAKKENVKGHVFISFVIEKDGSVANIKVDKGLGAGTDEEAVRVLKLSPKWIPGTQNGEPVRVKYNLPIKFANKML